jgi:hypothetical protein
MLVVEISQHVRLRGGCFPMPLTGPTTGMPAVPPVRANL